MTMPNRMQSWLQTQQAQCQQQSRGFVNDQLPRWPGQEQAKLLPKASAAPERPQAPPPLPVRAQPPPPPEAKAPQPLQRSTPEAPPPPPLEPADPSVTAAEPPPPPEQQAPPSQAPTP